MFDDGNITANRPKDTQRMLLPEGRSGSLLEYLHFDPPDIPAHPLVEDGAEKNAPSFSRYDVTADSAFGVRLRLDHRQKAHVLGFDLLEESVDLGGVPDIMRIHHTKDIAIDTVLLQESITTHRLLVGGLVVLGDAVAVMQFLWTVQAKPNSKALFCKKAAPFLIEEGSVGLHTVGDAPAGGLMLALKRYNLAKIVQPKDGWFTTMPGKADYRIGGSVDVLDNVLLQDVVGHAKRLAIRIKVFLLQVVTIVTVQVTDGANRFGKNLKFAGSFYHINFYLSNHLIVFILSILDI